MKFLSDMGVSVSTVRSLRERATTPFIFAPRDFSRWKTFRLRNQTPSSVQPRLFEVLSNCEADLNSGAIVVVEENGMRVAARVRKLFPVARSLLKA